MIESAQRAESVGVAPRVVGRRLVGAAEFRQLGGSPNSRFFKGGNGFRARVCGIDEAREGKPGGTGAERVMGTGKRRVDVETFSPRRSSPRAVGILVGDEEIHSPADGGVERFPSDLRPRSVEFGWDGSDFGGLGGRRWGGCGRFGGTGEQASGEAPKDEARDE